MPVEARRTVYAPPTGVIHGMAVDIALVLQSEHRRIRQLVDRCGRSSRGFHDPAAELAMVLRVHFDVAAREVYPSVIDLAPAWPDDRVNAVGQVIMTDEVTAPDLIGAAGELISVESDVVVPVLQEGKDVDERRRLGKVFRLRRDAQVRALNRSHRRQPSQTELYEMARRAGVQQRSKMTQAQLQQAIAGQHRTGR